MEETQLELMQLIASGKISRNRNFDRFRDASVRAARRSYERVRQLVHLLSSCKDELEVKSVPCDDGHVTLHLAHRKLNLTWMAVLAPHEVHALRQSSQVFEI